ncbi:MAG: pyrimidine dimer DNA glycosylase/endonuclease V [Thiovulaceae bacterium]|nr:pyrimidine dimer DNA glycosylase/endonuclease V [Sulfurimonadaceae bacterium]
MRLWSIHPGYLDSKGLVALWRESLLAQNVLGEKTKGYRSHPQLTRFKAATDPLGALADYLRSVADEADRRGYNFDRSKIIDKRFSGKIPVTKGQVEYELMHLSGKLKKRDPEFYARLNSADTVRLHPLFIQIDGEVEDWEVLPEKEKMTKA